MQKLRNTDAIDIAKKYARRVYDELDSQAQVYLFGSFARAENHADSDIDIAVVSKSFTEDVCKNYALVNLLAFDIDTNIDAQAIIYDDWLNATPFTKEVQSQGVLIK